MGCLRDGLGTGLGVADLSPQCWRRQVCLRSSPARLAAGPQPPVGGAAKPSGPQPPVGGAAKPKVDIENGELPQPGDIMRFAWREITLQWRWALGEGGFGRPFLFLIPEQ